jgi:hypothetical protein
LSDQVSATYRDGQVVFDAPVIWPSGTRLVVSPESKELCGDGTPWPQTKDEIAAWIAHWKELEPLELTPEELRRFDEFLETSRAEQKELMRRSWEESENLF